MDASPPSPTGPPNQPNQPSQFCPMCGRPVHPSPRYPDYLCAECVARATDRYGRAVRLGNMSLSGGFQAWFEDGTPAPEVTADGVVFVDRVPHHAQEAHMGGTVVLPWQRPASPSA